MADETRSLPQILSILEQCAGTQYFEITDEEARTLLSELKRLQEIAGRASTGTWSTALVLLGGMASAIADKPECLNDFKMEVDPWHSVPRLKRLTISITLPGDEGSPERTNDD